jgi:hypothetical protein
VGVALRECNSEPEFATSSPTQVFPRCYNPFISDPRVVAAVVNDQLLCALTLQVAEDGMALLMLPVDGNSNQKGHKTTVHGRRPPRGPFSG